MTLLSDMDELCKKFDEQLKFMKELNSTDEKFLAEHEAFMIN